MLAASLHRARRPGDRSIRWAIPTARAGSSSRETGEAGEDVLILTSVSPPTENGYLRPGKYGAGRVIPRITIVPDRRWKCDAEIAVDNVVMDLEQLAVYL